MDFTALHQGVILVASMVASVTFATAPAAPHDEVSLSHPEIVSFNIPAENVQQPETLQNLNILTQPLTDQLKLVIKEAEASEVTTVEQPPIVYTVSNPTPTPSASPAVEPSATPSASPGEKKPEPSKVPESKEKPEDKQSLPSGGVKQSLPSGDVKKETKSPEPSPTSIPVTTPNSPNADILFQMTNDYRAKMGKPAFEKDERLCKIAEARAPHVKPELAAGTLHKGFRELNLPYWATENIAAYATMKENFHFLSTDYIHRKAIESDHKYSCTACTGTSCSQIFSTFVPK